MHVRRSRVDAAVTTSSYRQVEDVGSEAILLEVSSRGAAGKLIGAQEARVHHRRRPADALLHQVVKGDAGGAFRHQRQDHEAAIAVGEPLAGRELGDVVAGASGIGLLGAERNAEERDCCRRPPGAS